MPNESRQPAQGGPSANYTNYFETDWSHMETPGAYVDRATGDLYRVPAESLVAGCSPTITKVSRSPSRLICISTDPYLPVAKARSLAADANVVPNF